MMLSFKHLNKVEVCFGRRNTPQTSDAMLESTLVLGWQKLENKSNEPMVISSAFYFEHQAE